ncbi:ATP-binding protein [Commensalibacter sp. ESL0382]|uniref:ATP-binding response regulator n=1 Tax=unclassified Commensalibacter TaxID=2630218 RepID=UPI0012D96792|nr:ATP-binding protein [Commensalibacter sp. ESL0382]MUG34872.1 PAS domain-containing protein [Commensalibacter sp. ESL0382]
MGNNTQPSILIIDNDSRILKEFKQILGQDYSLYLTESSYHALDMIKKGAHFSTIIYNNFMPCMFGNIFFARVRNLIVATRILLGPKSRTDILIKALNEGGISFFIPKPLDPFMVKEIVKRAVKRSEFQRKLMHERLLLKGLLDNLPYGLAFKDEEGRFTRMNQLAANRRGLTIAECLGKTEEETEPSFTSQELSRFNQRLKKEERFVEILEVPSNNSKQSSQWFMITRLLLDRAKGEITHPSVLMELDITKQKELEMQLRQSEKLKALGTMAGGIAHDFNNLLTTMIGSLELSEELLEVSGNSEIMDTIKQLQNNALEAAKKGSTLTERLLSFSRRKKLSLQEVDLTKTIQKNFDLLSQTLQMRYERRFKEQIETNQSNRIHLEFKNNVSGILTVKTDPSQFELAVMNLCINSVDAMKNGGVITIILDKKDVGPDEGKRLHLNPGPYAVTIIQDEGEGMSAETIAHIFEPFFTTKKMGLGTGLGMAMVYGFAQQSGGQVNVQSQLGAGTNISIYLPIYSEMER